MANSAAAAVVAQKLSSGSPQVDVPLPRLQWIEVFDQQAPLEPHRLPVPRLFQRGQEKCGRLQPAAVQFWMSRGLEKKVTAIFTVQIDQLLAFDGPTEESPFVDGARVVVCCNGMTVDPEILAKLPPLPNTDAVWQRITKSVNGHSAQNLWRHAHARVSAVVSFKVAMRPRTQSGTIIEKTDAKGDTKLQVDVTLPTEAQAEGLAEAQPKDVVGVAAATPVASAQKLTPSQSNMRKSRTCSDVGLTLSPKLVSVIGLERGGGGDSAPPKGMPALDPNAAPPRSRDVKELVDVGVQVDSPRMAQPPDKSRPFMVDASTSTEPWEIVIARASGAPVGSTKANLAQRLAEELPNLPPFDLTEEVAARRLDDVLAKRTQEFEERQSYVDHLRQAFEDMARTVYSMRKAYLKEVCNLKGHISRLKDNPQAEIYDESEIVFFDSSSYRIPSWTEIVDMLDNRRKEREELEMQAANGGPCARKLLPLRLCCKDCRRRAFSAALRKECDEPFQDMASQTEQITDWGARYCHAESQTEEVFNPPQVEPMPHSAAESKDELISLASGSHPVSQRMAPAAMQSAKTLAVEPLVEFAVAQLSATLSGASARPLASALAALSRHAETFRPAPHLLGSLSGRASGRGKVLKAEGPSAPETIAERWSRKSLIPPDRGEVAVSPSQAPKSPVPQICIELKTVGAQDASQQRTGLEQRVQQSYTSPTHGRNSALAGGKRSKHSNPWLQERRQQLSQSIPQIAPHHSRQPSIQHSPIRSPLNSPMGFREHAPPASPALRSQEQRDEADELRKPILGASASEPVLRILQMHPEGRGNERPNERLGARPMHKLPGLAAAMAPTTSPQKRDTPLLRKSASSVDLDLDISSQYRCGSLYSGFRGGCVRPLASEDASCENRSRIGRYSSPISLAQYAAGAAALRVRSISCLLPPLAHQLDLISSDGP